MTKKRKVLIGLIILDIIIIGIAVALTINLIKINKEEETQNKTENKIENIAVNNVIENKIVNEVKNNIVGNKLEENSTHTHEEEPIADPEQEVDISTIQKQESDQEKAINIAKEKWGKDDSVEFTFDYIDQNDGMYVIIIRDELTHEVGRYKVNIDTGECIEQ